MNFIFIENLKNLKLKNYHGYNIKLLYLILILYSKILKYYDIICD